MASLTSLLTEETWLSYHYHKMSTEQKIKMVEDYRQRMENGFGISTEQRYRLYRDARRQIYEVRRVLKWLSVHEEMEEESNGKYLAWIKAAKKLKQLELDELYNVFDFLVEIRKDPINPEEFVFDYILLGEYHSHILEYATGDQHKNAAEGALDAYQKASTVANSELKTTNQIRLSLALSFSMFHYEVRNDPVSACHLAKTAFDDAIADFEQMEEEDKKYFVSIMQLLKENLQLWEDQLRDYEEELN